MAVRVVRLGTARAPGEGLRLGTVRRPPRGVPRRDFAKRDFYDVWVPELAPSAPLVSWALATPWDDKRWKTYARKYVAEMKRPPASRLIELLAALSHTADFSVGCYCENEARCHRSLLREMLADAGGRLAG
ncbi:MAG TPA: DUF488 family protein [Gemmatimonadaceae bacterium]|nr:DUF488 family protein [Gemmatimonadaceae bacterium]